MCVLNIALHVNYHILCVLADTFLERPACFSAEPDATSQQTAKTCAAYPVIEVHREPPSIKPVPPATEARLTMIATAGCASTMGYIHVTNIPRHCMRSAQSSHHKAHACNQSFLSKADP